MWKIPLVSDLRYNYITVYHDTVEKFEYPDFSLCNIFTDFGQGFYVTINYEQAKQRCKYLKQKKENRNKQAYINEYRLYLNRIPDDCNWLSLPYLDEEWLDVILEGRRYGNIEIQEDTNIYYDIVEGGVADGDVWTAIYDYEDGLIEKDELFEEITKYPKHHQLVIANESLITNFRILEFKKHIWIK